MSNKPMMNHDAAYCLDYDPMVCPTACYRAQLTEEVSTRNDLVGIPLSYIAFYKSNDPECPRLPNMKPFGPWGDIIRRMDDDELADFISKGPCPPTRWHRDDQGCKCTECPTDPSIHGCHECWKAFLKERPHHA